jgi:DNA-binding CsgD family transcriptional regulator
MSAAIQPDLLAALRLIRDLGDAESEAAVRGAVLTDLPRSIWCDAVTWASDDLAPGPDADEDPDDHPVARLELRGDGRLAGLALHRGHDAFSDAELALLELLRPHLLSAMRRADQEARLCAAHLTPRERAVLALVAEGAANGAIAARLHMRPRTVEKHLEHAYVKLGVTSRTAAVAALREIPH